MFISQRDLLAGFATEVERFREAPHDPVVREFHLTAAQRMLDAGMLRLYLLRVGNSTAAGYYGFTAKRTAHAYLSGFDPEFAELSPGTQIVAHAIEEAVREGAHEFPARRRKTYKYAWGAVDRPKRRSPLGASADGSPHSGVSTVIARSAGPLSRRRRFRRDHIDAFCIATRRRRLARLLIGNPHRAAAECKQLGDLRRLAEANMEHLAQVTVLAKDGLVNIPSDDSDPVTAVREQFDRAVAVAPEASVALYSLGSAGILDRATSEIVKHLGEWGLLRSDAIVLDIGCGIGRIERALARQVGAITAIDISSGMIEEARRRCGDLANVAFEQCGGRNLAGFGTGLSIWCSRWTPFLICSPRIRRSPRNTCETPPGFFGRAGQPSS